MALGIRRTARKAPRVITMAHSPDPDDAFMCYALTQHKIRLDGFTIQDHLEDIQSLNRRALTGEFEVTAISAAAYPSVADKYWIMSSGASVGRGYGPIIVANTPMTLESLSGAPVAVPGWQTTATLALRLAAPACRPVVHPFDQILEVVARGEVAAGVVIHEGQLTYRQSGLHKVADLALWWEQRTGLPLPLGLDVVRKDLGKDLAWRITEALRASIHYAHSHVDDALTYALTFGRGLERRLGDRFVKMYVNADTLDLAPDCVEALNTLYAQAHAQGLLPSNPPLTII